MTTEQRNRVIEGLRDELTASSFAEGLEGKIGAALCQRTDEQLLALAKEKGTWVPA